MDITNEMPQFPKTYWRETNLPQFAKLETDLHVDVAIVGAGITGITTAYLLSKAGLKVGVMEAGSILNGTTGHTTAKITAQHGLIYDELISHFGEEKAKLYYESNKQALDFIRNVIQEHGIDCDFSEQDAFIYSTTEEYQSKLEKEYEAYQRLGIPGELSDSIPFNISIKNALSMKGQAQFHPLKYLTHLVKEATANGCEFYENTTAIDVEDGDSPIISTKSGNKVTCKHLVVASHFPFYDGMGFYFARMHAERSYVIGIKTKEEFPGGMYISADSPTRSIRSTPLDDGQLILIGGESHKTGQGKDTLRYYEALQEFSGEVFGQSEYIYRWSAQDLVSLDKVPYIGPIKSDKKNILVATGYKKWGMTSGTVAAQLMTDLITARENSYVDVYTPSRFNADPSLKNLITQNLDVAAHLLKGKLEFVPKSTRDLENDQGSVVIVNGKRAGAYKDKNGELFIVDTTCTHLGCECEWNHAEKTWDCSCHGSRFAYSGEVVEGPAKKPLKKISD
ncbi:MULTISPECIES: FAD-dependent oxidoreductase [unclassified Bacillus (in: firmicutes)]|uniref:FAD-dependent oxidoreductase n=1 Tax=unclassified Bacillus (in: firmicutes) TaxID=185979 RepID=UPI0008E95544|nr:MULTISPECIES: FAD-dependent oxidoreductase [unclassified Bacillus (in: firmicutes)]SFB08231.1 Glycine/D-amino acid oxidase [Bacillus sp. UNCCL13]SFQ87131.1 Glycine/D-amino acid oxidase [Bacillus sp. cl95]